MADDEYPNPIRVTSGGGMAVAFPFSPEVVDRLGGPDEISRRLRSVEPQRLVHPGQVGPEKVERVARAYDELLKQLESPE